MMMPRISLRCVGSLEVTVEDIGFGITKVPWQLFQRVKGATNKAQRRVDNVIVTIHILSAFLCSLIKTYSHNSGG